MTVLQRVATILLVDDDEAMRYTLARVLRRAGYNIVEAANGNAAIQRAQDHPDLIVLDVRLPDIDGIEVCRRLRADPTTASIPILQVSAERISAQDQVEGLEVGADAYLIHPIDSAVLTATVKALLRVRESERALAQSERFFQVVAEAIPQMVWSVRVDGRAEYVNRHWLDYTGVNLPLEHGRCWTAAAHPDEQARATQDWHAAQRDGIAFEGEYRLRRIDDTYRWFLVRAMPLSDEHGVVQKWFGSCTDIDVRLRAEKALASEKERLAVTLESIGDGVITTDAEARIELMNPVAEALTEWSQAEASGRALNEILRLLDARTRRPLENGIESGTTPERRLILIARNGEERMIEVASAPIRQRGAGMGSVVVLRDVTAKQRLEETLIKTQKLESLGVLAGGIAHDFNNLLTAILGNISLARLPGIDADELLTEAEKACLRARGLTQQLLTFAKGGAPIKRVISLESVVREAAEFSVRGLRAQCAFEFASDLPEVEADAGQIGQVVHNLVLNAAESMPEGGTIRVSLTRLGNIDQPAVQLAIADSGTGIPEKYLGKVFDPYFTTKQKGSGLGLAVVYSIVKKHDGEVAVESHAGRGTRFTITLPAVARVHKTRPPTPAASVDGGRILLMDDEDAILQFARHVLTKLGYSVSTVRDGASAIARIEQAIANGERFIVAILDLTIPGGMGGKECAAALRQCDPGLKLVAASGYSTDPIMCEPHQHGFDGVLAKPFLPEELVSLIGVLLSPH